MCTHLQNKHNCVEDKKEGKKYKISFIFLDSILFALGMKELHFHNKISCFALILQASSLKGASELQGNGFQKKTSQ